MRTSCLMLQLFFTFFVSLTLKAQTCNCAGILEKAIDGVTENYALFKIKVDKTNETGFRSYNNVFMAKAKEIENTFQCQKLMDKWVLYFNDKHLWITVTSIDKKISYTNLHFNLKNARKHWNNRMIAKDPIEGLWEMDGYRAAIVPDTKNYGSFNAIIVSSDNQTFKPGMLKMHLVKRDAFYDMDFYRRDSTMVKSRIRFTAPHLLVDDDDITWRRMEPHTSGAIVPSLAELSAIDNYKPTLRWLDLHTAYFILPSCAPRYAQTVDSLVKTNESKLANCEQLIVDVRQNGGGSDRTYRALLPYILTNEVDQPKVGYYMSEENVKMFRSIGILKNLDPADTVKRGVWVRSQKKATLSAPVYHKNPVNVAILIDGKTASSGETFVLKSKCANRVLTFGQATAGCIDGYNGNVIDLGGAELRYATSIRTFNLPQDAIDPFGILPDVPISLHEANPIEFILSYLKNLPRK